MDYTAHYPSPLGNLLMASDGNALVGLWFDGQQHFAETLDAETIVRPDLQLFARVQQWLDLYFGGIMPDFVPPLQLRDSDFQKRVWRALLAIPVGQTETYGGLAKQLGCRSAQAIGLAVGRNPISIIVPCHRVVGAEGALIGYAAGVDIKRWLLEWERTAFSNNSKNVDFLRHLKTIEKN